MSEPPTYPPAELDVLVEFRAVFERWLAARGMPEPDAKSTAALLPTT